MVPDIRYVRSGEISIAYQVIGDRPFDLVWAPGAVSHVELKGVPGERMLYAVASVD